MSSRGTLAFLTRLTIGISLSPIREAPRTFLSYIDRNGRESPAAPPLRATQQDRVSRTRLRRFALLLMAGLFVVTRTVIQGQHASAAPGPITEYSIPTSSSTPKGIVTGLDGNLWFTEQAASANKIGKVTRSGSYRLCADRVGNDGGELGSDFYLWAIGHVHGRSGGLAWIGLGRRIAAHAWRMPGHRGSV
jgi:hypothetical protein